MKKIFLIVAATVLMASFTACTSDEVANDNSAPATEEALSSFELKPVDMATFTPNKNLQTQLDRIKPIETPEELEKMLNSFRNGAVTRSGSVEVAPVVIRTRSDEPGEVNPPDPDYPTPTVVAISKTLAANVTGLTANATISVHLNTVTPKVVSSMVTWSTYSYINIAYSTTSQTASKRNSQYIDFSVKGRAYVRLQYETNPLFYFDTNARGYYDCKNNTGNITAI